MRILIILNTDPEPQGVTPVFDGLIEAYYLFCDAGVDVVVASPGGGSASGSTRKDAGRQEATASPHLRRFKADRPARDVMNDLLDLASVCVGDFAAALCLGPLSLGAPGNAEERGGFLVAELLAAAKPVAIIAPSRPYASSEAINGLLIVGSSAEAPRLAARALLGAVR
jgi:hypothetical protein